MQGDCAGVQRPAGSFDQVGTSLGGPEQRVARLEECLNEQYRLLFEARLQLAAISNCRGWKLLLRCYGIRNRLFPSGSRRRAVLDQLIFGTINLVKVLMGRRCPSSISSRQYARWLRENEPTASELAAQRLAPFVKQPKISIVVPTYNTPGRFLRPMLESVIAQTYANWELCLADGSDPESSCRKILAEYSEQEPRIRLTYLAKNLGIAGNSNAALELARGDFVAFLDHDDTLAPDALYEIARAVNDVPDADLIYSDEDKISEDGSQRYQPHFKPDWSPEFLRSCNYICHFLALHRDLLEKIGPFRDGFDGSQDYDLILRATEQAHQIVHVPRVLYHWRCHATSTAGSSMCKPQAYEAGRHALQDHLVRMGQSGEVTLGLTFGVYQTSFSHDRKPLISIIIPNKDNSETLRRCIDSLRRSRYQECETIVVENNSVKPGTFEYYKQIAAIENTRVLEWSAPFNYAALNNFAAGQCRGELLLFLNNDVEAINTDWLDRLVEHALRPEIGAVGGKLYYPCGTIQHAGLVLGIRGTAGHSHRNHRGKSYGYCHRLISTQNVSAVTGACLMMRKAVFEQIGGFDEQFSVEFNDVDLCLKVRTEGYHIVWTPHARLWHHECKTRGSRNTVEKRSLYEKERTLFETKWGKVIRNGDPYYNPNLTLEDESFTLARRSRMTRPSPTTMVASISSVSSGCSQARCAA